MLINSPSSQFISIIIMLMISTLVESQQIHNELRLLQISPLQTLAYSSYTSIQIFHLLNWQQNDKIIKEINNHQSKTFIAAHNQFSYLSINQIKELYLTLNITPFRQNNVKATQTTNTAVNNPKITAAVHTSSISDKLVQNIDWRKTLSSTVKNQGKCGACWAFSAAADLESYYMFKYGYPIDFSQQQLIDCSHSYGNVGCSGGMMNSAYIYVVDFGITLQSFYPYKEKTDKCNYDGKNMPHFTIKQSKVIQSDCNALSTILKQRPVSVVISANPSFIFYQSGILNECGSLINHSLQLVGLVSDSTGNYYIGKNSWGTKWGLQGYVYINSVLQQGNLCNVCAFPQYPI